MLPPSADGQMPIDSVVSSSRKKKEKDEKAKKEKTNT